MNELFEKPGPVDMSPEAIASRLRMLGELYKLGMSLRKATPIVERASSESGQSTLPIDASGSPAEASDSLR
jgi:hypothetical protein